nr:Mu transposase C-terminal domain-containing protein [Paenibacillus anseongense]
MTAKVTRFGLELKGNTKLCYACKEGEDAGWFISEILDGKKEIEVSYDPRDCSAILIRLDSGKLIPCSLTERFNEYKGLNFEDAKAIFDFKKQEYTKLSSSNMQAKAERRALAASHLKADVAAKKAAKTYSNEEKPSGKREATAKEAEFRDRVDAFTKQWEEQRQEVIQDEVEIIRAATSLQLSSTNKLSDFLRNKHKEKKGTLHA